MEASGKHWIFGNKAVAPRPKHPLRLLSSSTQAQGDTQPLAFTVSRMLTHKIHTRNNFYCYHVGGGQKVSSQDCVPTKQRKQCWMIYTGVLTPKPRRKGSDSEPRFLLWSQGLWEASPWQATGLSLKLISGCLLTQREPQYAQNNVVGDKVRHGSVDDPGRRDVRWWTNEVVLLAKIMTASQDFLLPCKASTNASSW